jgi:hypothetical protein
MQHVVDCIALLSSTLAALCAARVTVHNKMGMLGCCRQLTVSCVCVCCVLAHLPCRFELLCRIRIARGFGALATRRQLVKQRLLAFNVLLQCSPTAGEAADMWLHCALPSFVHNL